MDICKDRSPISPYLRLNLFPAKPLRAPLPRQIKKSILFWLFSSPFFKTTVFKGTVSPAQNRLKVVWSDRPWLGHPSL